jgi:glycosyltransferase involved in cell wall biosynthesis
VNEAAASGLPLIISDRCGCAPELVQQDVNGFTFDPYEEGELTQRLTAISSLPESRLVEMGEASARIVRSMGPAQFAEGMEKAVRLALSRDRNTSIMNRFIAKALRYL